MLILLLHMDAVGNLYLIANLSLLTVFSTCVVFSKYFEGIIPSLIQTKSAPRSISATHSKETSLPNTMET